MMEHGGKELAAELDIGLAIGKTQAQVHKCTTIQGQTCWGEVHKLKSHSLA